MSKLEELAREFVALDIERSVRMEQLRMEAERLISEGHVSANKLAAAFGVSGAFISDVRKGSRSFGKKSCRKFVESCVLGSFDPK